MELGATVCVPGQPECLSARSLDCVSRGEVRFAGNGPAQKSVRQKRRDICYSLDHRNSSVFLVQRPKHASLMPGMWELPEIPVVLGGSPASLTLRHSITVTDYTVHVMRGPVPGMSQRPMDAKSPRPKTAADRLGQKNPARGASHLRRQGWLMKFADYFRRTKMAALEPGTKAPDFTLPTMEGSQFSLSEALACGPVVRYFSRSPAQPASTPFPFCREFMRRTDTKASPS